MAIQLTEDLNNLYTTTWQKMKDTVRDQIFDAMPFYFMLRDKGHIEAQEGHRFLTEPLQYSKNDNVTWITKGGTVSLNDYEFLTIAQYDWRYLVAPVVRFMTDDQQNRGRAQIINLMNAKLENTRNSLSDELESRLFAGDGSSDNAIDGLQQLVPDDPTVAGSSIGGIDPSTYTWWRNQQTDMTGSSFSTNGIANMRTLRNDCRNNLGMDEPNLIVSGQRPYEWYEDTVLDFYQTTNRKLADAGFENQSFKGLPMVWSPSCADTRMYFLNLNFIKMKFDPMLNFDMTDWKPIPEQPNDVAAQIVYATAMTVSRRRCHGVLHGIDTE